MKRRMRRPLLAGLAAFLVVLGVGAILFSGDTDTAAVPPADAGTLAHIARKNDAAAIRAAAHMKAEAGRTDAAAEALASMNAPPG